MFSTLYANDKFNPKSKGLSISQDDSKTAANINAPASVSVWARRWWWWPALHGASPALVGCWGSAKGWRWGSWPACPPSRWGCPDAPGTFLQSAPGRTSPLPGHGQPPQQQQAEDLQPVKPLSLCHSINKYNKVDCLIFYICQPGDYDNKR